MPYTDHPPRRSFGSRASVEVSPTPIAGASPPRVRFSLVDDTSESNHGVNHEQPAYPAAAVHHDPSDHFPIDVTQPERYPTGYYTHRGSEDSDATLLDEDENTAHFNFSSYRHPYDIQPPSYVHDPYTSHRSSESREYRQRFDSFDFDEELADITPRSERHRGLFANLLELRASNSYEDEDEDDALGNIRNFNTRNDGPRPWGFRRIDSLASEDDQILDPDDPTITGQRKKYQDNPEDVEKNVLRGMNYKARRKEKQRMRIEFNITSVVNRQSFIMRLAKALMVFGAPSHRIESQLLSAARILEVDAELIHIPNVIICSFGDQDTKTTETHFVKCGGRLSLGSLHQVHQIYRAVVHDEISAKKATIQLETLLAADPIYGIAMRLILAFCISALICPLAFGGSLIDMWIAGLGAVGLHLMQIMTAHKGQIYANVFEVSATIGISFTARGLSTIPGQIFCYTAISSAGIVSILPGYLILSSSLELASKNVVCGSVKMVYALIYTLFLGFGLQIGSDFYLLFDHNARDDLTAATTSEIFTISGNFVADTSTAEMLGFVGEQLAGTFTFSNSSAIIREHIVKGCYRPPTFPWYLQPFPWWAQFIIVPTFSVLSSLANLQPWKSWDLVVMVVISCISYASNKIANLFIFERSDVVSAIGAFAVGLLGNIYSRRMGGTAFTSMVTGVLFLVPSGLSQAGGITAQGNGIEIGNAMVAVTIGITVGLFMSQSIVYMFGSRKNAAIFSF